MIIVRADSSKPVPRKRRGRPAKYPWDSMAVGESFPMKGLTIADAVRQYWAAGKRHGRKFTAQSTGPGTRHPDEPRGARVWRTE